MNYAKEVFLALSYCQKLADNDNTRTQSSNTGKDKLFWWNLDTHYSSLGIYVSFAYIVYIWPCLFLVESYMYVVCITALPVSFKPPCFIIYKCI